MSQCINCGCNLIGTPENPALPHLCHYCEIHSLKEKVQVLREALEFLMDMQNGPPLVTWEKEWNNAIQNAKRALAITMLDTPRGGAG